MESIYKFWQNVENKAKGFVPLQVFPAVVKSVDKTARTCTVRVNDNVDIEDVRLYAVVDDKLKGFCMIPAKDSTVLVGRIANSNELYVTTFSVIDEIIGTIGSKDEMKVSVSTDGIVFNDGNNGGLINIATLTEKINDLIKAFNDHTHTIASISTTVTGTLSAGAVSGSGTASNVSVPAPKSKASELNKDDYEDTKIKH